MTDERTFRIEFVLPTLHVGGMEVVMTSLAMALARRGHAVGVTCLFDTGPVAERLHGTSVALSQVDAPGLRTILWAPALQRHFRSRRPDVVHSNTGSWDKPARAAKHALGCATVHTAHGREEHESWIMPMQYRLAARSTDVVVPVSEELRRFLIETMRLPPGKLEVVTNGVFCAEARPTLRPVADPVRIGIIARLVAVKQHDLLLNAFALLRQGGVNAHLSVVGDGPLRASLESLTASLGITAHVEFTGAVSDVTPLMSSFDIVALSSAAEGLPMALLEALAAGRAVVSTSVGGITALLADDAGVLVEPGNAEALCEGLRRLCVEPEFRQAIAANGFARVRDHYSFEQTVNHYVRIYSRLVTPPR
jgi:glycosyltransferase involved in cell wall biosynthesis